MIYLSTAPENEVGLHVYHKVGFKETGEIEDGEAIFVLKL
jgi:RimJ/RimL family protein N-acetyltransferase